MMTKALISKFMKRGVSVGDEEIKVLHSLLEGSPLGINQAISYLKQNPTISFRDYLDKLKEGNKLILNLEQNSNIFTTLILSLYELKRKDILVDDVMSAVAYLSAEHLEVGLLEEFLKKDIKNAVKLLIDYYIF